MRISDWSSDVCSSDLRKVLTMRLAGRISDWNDDKGYGFVTPNGGVDRAFVHIKAFQSGSRLPVDGDLISYAVTRDGRGRSNAAAVRFAGERLAQSKPTRHTTPIRPRLPGSAALLPRLVGAAARILSV